MNIMQSGWEDICKACVLHCTTHFRFFVFDHPGEEASLLPSPAVAASCTLERCVYGMLSGEKTLSYVFLHIDVIECRNSVTVYSNILLGRCLRQDVGHNR
jgi:hypothetical protein